MKRPQYVFRPNLNEPQHRRAWALLQQVPPAKRKEFLVQSILVAEQTDRLEKSIRKVVREELQAVNITGAVPSPLSENGNSLSPKNSERIRWTGKIQQPCTDSQEICAVAANRRCQKSKRHLPTSKSNEKTTDKNQYSAQGR